MKTLFLFILLVACIVVHAQLHLTVDTFNGDTTISTGYQALNTHALGGKNAVTDSVIGVRVISRKQSTYWLFFSFIPYDIPAANIRISNRNFAYIKTAKDYYYRIRYTGKTYTSSTNTKANFYIDVTDYAAQLSRAVITNINLETSVLYHSIQLQDTSQQTIANIINALLSY